MEFLFRGVLKKENLDEPNKWIYGGIYPVPKKKGCFSYIITRNSAYYHQFKKEEVYTVTVGEYTGENDKEYTYIFSDDIVETETGARYLVHKKGALYYLVPVNGDDNVALLLTDVNGAKVKVIGNRFDNKDLIERRISL